jgi:hypothetical protein
LVSSKVHIEFLEEEKVFGKKRRILITRVNRALADAAKNRRPMVTLGVNCFRKK